MLINYVIKLGCYIYMYIYVFCFYIWCMNYDSNILVVFCKRYFREDVLCSEGMIKSLWVDWVYNVML